MTEHRPSSDLSPALGAVLSSLSVNLEAELNRYRRTRHTHPAAEDDIFADLDAVFENPSDLGVGLEAAHTSIAVPAVAIASAAPPPPTNKKLLNGQLLTAQQATPQRGELDRTASPQKTEDRAIALSSALTTQPHSDQTYAEPSSAQLPKTALQTLMKQSAEGNAGGIQPAPSRSYLSSSEKLIESLTEVADMPEPISITPEPKRKTVSLMAGAALGLLALVAGLGASYVMSNPDMAQALAGGFTGRSNDVKPTAQPTFDPPGPDLSAQEFVDLKLDNLSSLNMRTRPDPLATAQVPVPPTLPPIERAAPLASQSRLPTLPPISQPTAALSIPAGANYYVTIPFSTEQGLIDVRKAVEEAFVRQFSDGNYIQLAVFDNPRTAQSFIAKLQTKGVQAQLYGPTVE